MHEWLLRNFPKKGLLNKLGEKIWKGTTVSMTNDSLFFNQLSLMCLLCLMANNGAKGCWMWNDDIVIPLDFAYGTCYR